MVPDGWEEHCFGEIVRLANGQVDPKVEPYSSMPHVGPENIQSGTGKLSGVRSAAECGVISGKYEFDEHAIVYSKIRPNLNKVALPGYHGICSADMYPIWGSAGVAATNYLLHLMLSSRFVAATTAVSLRTGMPKINRPDLNAIKVHLPPLPEQRKIAEILSTWDHAIETSEALLATARRQKRALMQSLLTGKRRFPEFEGQEWKEVRLGEIAKIIVSNVDKKSKDGEQPVRLCNYTDVYKRDTIDPTQEFMEATATPAQIKKFGLTVGDVIITKDSETADDIAMPTYVAEVAADLVCGYHLAIVRPGSKLDGRFLKFFFELPHTRYYFGTRANGAIRFGLTIDGIVGAKLQLPPIDEQKRIAAVIAESEVEIMMHVIDIEKLRAEKKALMQQLLTGKRRVVE